MTDSREDLEAHMAETRTPFDYGKYDVLTRRFGPGFCQLCGKDILVGESYHNGGYGRRAHVKCVKKQRKKPAP